MTDPQGELINLIPAMTRAQHRQLLNIARAMHIAVEGTVSPESDIVTPEFDAEIKARLQAHHGTHTQPLDRTSWEDAFLAGAEASGRSTSSPTSATNRYFDKIVNGQKTALKSTKAQDVRVGQLHISKLCEAAWIQDCRGSTMRHAKALEAIRAYTNEVDRLLQLRVLPAQRTWHYELVEVPMRLFDPIFKLPVADFAPDSPRIAVTDGAGLTMKLILDRSDAKITLATIPKSRCVVHAEWILPKRPEDNDN